MTSEKSKEQQCVGDRCDCGARLKYKCSKHGGHKMCAESLVGKKVINSNDV